MNDLFDMLAELNGESSLLQECNDCRSGRSATSPAAAGDVARFCGWCSRQLIATTSKARFCSQVCRQWAFRIRRRHQVSTHNAKPLKIAYADPPYPGMSARFYKGQSSYAGEVDHAALISSLVDRFDGWALSTGAYALRDILPLCPPQARICAWVKPIGAFPKTYGLHNTWEPLIVVPGRALRPGKRDWLAAQPARNGGELPGRKPLAFCGWLFDCLGMLPGDHFEDLFPGSGIVGRAWAEICRGSS